jgi:hypothetical protein
MRAVCCQAGSRARTLVLIHAGRHIALDRNWEDPNG